MNEDVRLRSYVTGFILSVVLTLAAYFIVVEEKFAPRTMLLAVAGLAVIQLIVQLVFFLHLGREKRPRWNLMAFIFAIGVVIIVVFGSLWIMLSLDSRHGQDKSPEELEQYIIEDEGISR